jgi:hypothetical protein
MSLLAETMEALRFTDEQNHLILHGGLSNTMLSKYLKRPVRQIQRQRALLKRQQAGEGGQA